MKQIFIMLTFVLVSGTLTMGKPISSSISTAQPSDTLKVSTDSATIDTAEYISDFSDSFDETTLSEKSFVTLVSAISLLCTPVLIVLIVLAFRYKNKKEQYKLVTKALEAGKDLPEGLFASKEKNTLSTGIINISIGIGLFIMLYGLTGQFSIGTIGLLIMFIGLGQVVIYFYTHPEAKRNPFAKGEEQSCRKKEKEENKTPALQSENATGEPEEE